MHPPDGKPVEPSPIARGLAASIDVPPPSPANPEVDANPRSGLTSARMLQSKTAVLLTLFCVTGFLGIPLLWMNKRFSNLERGLWTVMVCLYTLSLIAGTVAVVRWAYSQVIGA